VAGLLKFTVGWPTCLSLSAWPVLWLDHGRPRHVAVNEMLIRPTEQER
jgi:hypothetical protein